MWQEEEGLLGCINFHSTEGEEEGEDGKKGVFHGPQINFPPFFPRPTKKSEIKEEEEEEDRRPNCTLPRPFQRANSFSNCFCLCFGSYSTPELNWVYMRYLGM